jgi:glycosyltransferase involved in cell wall biosynthesis
MKIVIRQVKGNSGIDVWAENLFRGIAVLGHECTLDLRSPVYQFLPPLARLHTASSGCDIMQGNSWNGFAFKEGCPLVVTDHGVVNDSEYRKYQNPSQKIYHRWIFYCEDKTLEVSDKVVCVSNNARDCLEDTFGFSDAIVIHNGIDQSIFKPIKVDRTVWNISRDKTVLFYSGNMSRRKGADLLPSIMKQLGDNFVLLTTIGKKGQSQESPIYSLDLGYLNLDQLVQVYNLCDIFIIPSRLEGLSLSVLEAMACGKPVVASNCSSLPEQIVDGEGGLLCEKDNSGDFADKIRYLSENEEERTKMGIFNRQSVIDNFQIERMVKQYVNLYRSL